jgi:hypothetical protein
MRRWHSWTTVVAAKKYNGIIVGYIVGWQAQHTNQVRNIRAGKYFATQKEAEIFQKEIEAGRDGPGVQFEILTR